MSKYEKAERPNLKNYFTDLTHAHDSYTAAPELFQYAQAHDSYIDELEAAALLRQQGWISVEEKPLVIQTSLGWEATNDGNGEFLAAVPYHDKKDGKDHWWIRHCVLEDEIGLCVVGDMDNEPAGWQTTDVTHYWPLPLPPTSK
jgi:hypothetical protein